jgi:hypothetical protein
VDRKTLTLTVRARAWIIRWLYMSSEEMELTISVEKIYEPFEYSDNGEGRDDDPFHPRPSSGDVDSSAWDHEILI